MAVRFEIRHHCRATRARLGRLLTPHAEVETPAFMPVGTQASVKTLGSEEVAALGARMVLCNTYHLSLRPGAEVIRAAGGLHRFMAWPHGILTDSGGFQVLSLAGLREVSDEGITFTSHLDGSRHFLGPEGAVAIQEALGADILMALDECPPYPVSREEAARAAERTWRWAVRCRRARRRTDQALFGIVQGSVYPDLRADNARRLSELDLPGYGIGGLSVGEPKAVTYRVLEELEPYLPADRPRYLMGVGAPEDLLEAVARGVDLFDSVLPTRIARHGTLFTATGPLSIRNAVHARDFGPPDPDCACPVCRTYSRAYLRHLFKAGEVLAMRLASIHNLSFLLELTARVRRALADGTFPAFKEEFLGRYRRPGPAGPGEGPRAGPANS